MPVINFYSLDLSTHMAFASPLVLKKPAEAFPLQQVSQINSHPSLLTQTVYTPNVGIHTIVELVLPHDLGASPAKWLVPLPAPVVYHAPPAAYHSPVYIPISHAIINGQAAFA